MTLTRLRHISRALLSLLAAIVLTAVLTGCAHDEPSLPAAADGGDYEVSIRFNTAAVSGTTRAVDDEEFGTLDESHVNLNDFKILLFDENQVLYDVFYDCGGLVSVRGSETLFEQLGPYTYLLRVKISGEHYSRASKFAIVALANWQRSGADNPALSTILNGLRIDRSAIGSLTLADLRQTIFTLNPKATDAWLPGNGNWIPMFGSLHASLEAYDRDIFNAANPMPLGTVNLVRALAKIEVINRDLSDFAPKIIGMDLMYRNIRGSLVQNFDFGGATGQVAAPTVPATATINATSIPFSRDDNRYTIYVPEMSFGYSSAIRQAIRLTLDLGDGQQEVKWIYLAPYDSRGLPILADSYADPAWNALLRNHIYRYTINSLAFEFLVSVKKWDFGGKVHIQFEQEDDED